ncbi:MAG: VCBS repeat-containing protein [Lewinellaceae bacterium]|nr:VCBS repeat-containing protein [Lewinellaceae bacterium]
MKRSFLLLIFVLSLYRISAQSFGSPALSPDGKRLAVTVERNGQEDLWIAGADGADARPLVESPGWDVHPRWSPDGSRLLFNTFPLTADEPHDVFTIRPDGSDLRNLTQGKFPDGQANDWFPDGQKLLFSSGKYPSIQLFTMDIDAGGVHRLTSGEQMTCTYASCSPDGKKILFVGYADPDRDLYIMNPDGSGMQKIARNADAPAWSPDGALIVYQKKTDKGVVLYQVKPDGSGDELLSGVEIPGTTPAWSPDGKRILYARRNDARRSEIWSFDLQGRQSHKILPAASADRFSGIDPQNICRHIDILASDAYMGRRPGTPGEEKSVNYIRGQFESLGLQPGNGDRYTQEVNLATFNPVAPAKIKLRNTSGELEWLSPKDFLLASEKAAENIRIDQAPIIFAGFGIHAPEIGWDDYAGVDIRGKIVVVLSGAPDLYTQDSLRWKGDPAANLYGQTFYKKNEAAQRGAVGLLTIFREQAEGFYTWDMLANVVGHNVTTILKNPEKERQLDFSGLINRHSANALFRFAGLEGLDFQKRALEPNFRAFPLDITVQFSFSNTWTALNTQNVVGLLPGTDRADEVILYTAHWDHVGTGPAINGDSIRNGAVDNASGTAALIEIARAYKALPSPPRRSILFIATTAEEIGLLGAVYYAAHPLFPIGKTVASLNMDSHFPYGKTTHAAGVVYGRSGLDGYLEAAARQQGRILVPNTQQNIQAGIFFRSDHFPLAEVGVPSEFAVGFGGAGADSTVWAQKAGAYMGMYHQPTDEYTPDFDCSGISQDAELVFLAGKALAQSDEFPAWHANQPFQRFRERSRFETAYFRDVSRENLPVRSLQGRSMDAQPLDADGDGDLDLAVANEWGYNILLINDGKGKFTDESDKRLPLGRHDSEDIAAADFDGDGDADLIFVSEDDQVNEYFENDGKGFFRDVSFKIPITGTSNAVVATDLNGDGRPDLLIGNAGQNFCLINDGKGNWKDETAERLPRSAKTTQDLELGDVDGDGDPDLVVANEDDSEIWINNGQGRFTDETAQRLPVKSGEWETREARLADVDGDRDLDLFLANVNFRGQKDSQNRLFLNNGKGQFTDVTQTHLPQEKRHTVDGKFQDLDGDGDLDLITGNGFGNFYEVYLNDGKGRFRNATQEYIPAATRGDGIDIEVADFNGDGIKDLYLCNFQGSDFLLLGKKG